MIISFRHKGLEALFKKGSSRGVQAAHVPKLQRILAFLDIATTPADMDYPGYKLHLLKGDMKGHWSVWVNGNWRVTFRFIGTDVELVDYKDTIEENEYDEKPSSSRRNATRRRADPTRA
ncbi:type II toxin-antitoxin system RelE/ParE family toxin [Brucella sp. IR073]